MSTRNWYIPVSLGVIAIIAVGGLMLASMAMVGGSQAPAPAPAPTTGGADHAPTAPEASSEPRLAIKAYEVPKHMQKGIVSILRETTPFNVMVGPANRIVVAAPEHMQPGIATFIEEMSDVADVAPQHPATIEMTYWLVLGTPGESGVSPEATEIQGALDAVVANQGPMSLTVLERVTLMSVDGEEGKTGGRRVHVEQQVGERDGAILANLAIGTTHGQRLETRVRLEEGQTLVLGQVGTSPKLRVGGEDELVATADDAVIFFVVRARVLRDEG